MARVASLLPYQWRAYWRNIKARSLWAGANLTMVLVLGMLALPGHVAGCLLAAARMRADPAGQGLMLSDMMLTGLLIGWLMLPMIAAGVQARGQAIAPAHLIQFPLSVRQLFMIGVTGALVQPVYWILLFASAFCLLPLLAGPSPLMGLCGGLLFVAAAALFSWGITLLGTALFSTRRGREIALSLISALMIGVVFLAQFDLETDGREYALEGFDRRILLINTDGSEGLLTLIRAWTPAAWAARSAMGEIAPLLGLVAATALAFGLSLWSLKRVIHHPVAAGSGGRGKLRPIASGSALPPALGAITSKEIRYLARTMDAWLGFALGLGGAAYFLIKSEPQMQFLLFAAPLVMVVVTAMPMNCFGLDRKAVDRYRLLPLSGRDVILSKNLAYAIITAAQVGPIIMAAAVRFGLLVGLATLLGSAGYMLLLILWGNTISVRVPAPREFFNFDSKEQAGGIASQLYAMFVCGIPILAAVIGHGAGKGPGLLVGEAVVLAICLAIYRARLNGVGRLFEEKAETMRDRLAA